MKTGLTGRRQRSAASGIRRNDTITKGHTDMKHIQTLDTRDMEKSAANGGCGECQTSCQSACKTSCGIANQACENDKD